MRTALVVPEEWAPEQAEAFVKQIIDFIPSDQQVVLVMSSSPPDGFTSISLATALKDDETNLVFYLNSVKDSFRIESGSGDKLFIHLKADIPSSAEVESQALGLLYSHNSSIRKFGQFLLDTWCLKTPVLVCFQDVRFSEIERNTILNLVQARFGHRGAVIPVDSSEKLGTLAKDEFIRLWVLVAKRGELHLLVPPPDLISRIEIQDIELHIAGPEGYLTPFKLENGTLVPHFDASTNPQIEEHIFARLTQRKLVCSWYLFPYGYGLLQSNGNGPVSSFGFRNTYIPGSELDRRPKNHKVIAVFGGSAVHAIEVPHHLTMCSVLEDLLNQESSDDFKCTVLNFGLGGHLLLNQIITFVLFCHQLKPDMVISHDGTNDLAIGLINDPTLIGNYQMAYPPNFEPWGQMLQSTLELPLSQDFSPDKTLKLLNSPQKVLASYLERKKQFMNLVRTSDSEFVWGFQPCAFAKELSNSEKLALEIFFSKSIAYKEVYEKLPMLYEQYKRLVEPSSHALTVDCHAEFSKLTKDMDCFCDIVHLTAFGNAKCAEIYAQAITTSKVWQKWTRGNSND